MTSNSTTAWVTGAGHGIGRGVAKALAVEGRTVAVSSRTREDLEALAAECEAEAVAGRILVHPCDITNAEEVARTVAAIEAEAGPLGLAVLNAGTHVPTPVEEFTSSAMSRLVGTNLMGTVHCLEPLIRNFRARGTGHIAVVASVAGYRGLPTAAGYGATKAALINMCEALKPELERDGVRLTLINPGFVKTPLTDKNTFPMPFLISVEEAVSAIMRGLRSSGFEVAFPRRFAVLMKLLAILPDGLFFRITRRMIKR